MQMQALLADSQLVPPGGPVFRACGNAGVEAGLHLALERLGGVLLHSCSDPKLGELPQKQLRGANLCSACIQKHTARSRGMDMRGLGLESRCEGKPFFLISLLIIFGQRGNTQILGFPIVF